VPPRRDTLLPQTESPAGVVVAVVGMSILITRPAYRQIAIARLGLLQQDPWQGQ
jgi:hypothetical protein